MFRLLSQNADMQRLTHDFKKHIQVIENIENEKKEIRKEYIEELMKSINSIQQQFQYEDKIVCTILLEKVK